MNALVELTPGLVPTTMAEAMKLAEMMASAKLVPVGLQKSPADCLMVIQQAIRWQMDPFAVAQECSVIQGKLMHTGKLVAAVVNARGNLVRRLSFDYSGEGDNRTITVSGQLKGESEPRTVAVVLKNVRTSNSMWMKQTDQQLMYSGTRVWARRHTPELMLGVYSPEEWEEQARADAEAAVASGTSIHHPDDYADGTPEKLTKPKEEAKHQRMTAADARWEEKINGWVAEVDGKETVEDLDAWISKHSIEAGSIPDRHKELQNKIYRVVRLKRAALHANLVVHDTDDAEPRPATEEDFQDVKHPIIQSISDRPISMRERDGVPEFLDRRK